jgi:hypothetical protein
MTAGESLLPEAAQGEAPGPARSGLAARRLRAAMVPAVCALGVIAGFACYLRLARTRSVTSDGAGNALQAWDMHGNLLLHGWSLSDVSFYPPSCRNT